MSQNTFLSSVTSIGRNFKKIYWSLRENTRMQVKNHFVDPVCVCSVRGKKILLGYGNVLERYRAWSYETKEPETLDWIDSSINSASVFYDIGANIGLYSLYAAMTAPQAKVICFEPAATNFVRLARNIKLNQLTNISSVNVALAENSQFGYLHLSDLEYGSALHSFGAGPVSEDKFKQGIISTTIDDLVYKWGIDHPTHIKIDVDGNELDILKGASRVLSGETLREVLIEVSHEGEIKDPALVLLEQAGFEVVQKSQWSVTNGSSTYRNYILRRTS